MRACAFGVNGKWMYNRDTRANTSNKYGGVSKCEMGGNCGWAAKGPTNHRIANQMGPGNNVNTDMY